MLTSNHPDDERLSALASHDTDVVADSSLSDHVSDCARCSATVREFEMLRMALAELPDVAPPRPLRLLPDVPDSAGADRVAGWVRRFFAPVLAAGAALTMVGLVGTAAPALDGMASGPGQAPAEERAAAPSAAGEPAGGADADTLLEATDGAAAAEGGGDVSALGQGDEARDSALTTLPDERPLWPMLLFTGVAIMVGAALLRWILVPRAG